MKHDERRAFRARKMMHSVGFKLAPEGEQAVINAITDLLHLSMASDHDVQRVIGASLTDRTPAVTEAETSATFPVGRDETEPYMAMYAISGKQRVIVFGGLLNGMIAALDGTPSWPRAFALRRRLGINVQPIYGYTGSLAEVEK